MMLRLSFKKKIFSSVGLAVAGFAALGTVATLAFHGLSDNVDEAGRVVAAVNIVTDSQIAILTMADDSRYLGSDDVDAFLTRIAGEERRILDSLATAQQQAGESPIAEAMERMADLTVIYGKGLAESVRKKAKFGLGADAGQMAAVIANSEDLEESVGGYSSLSNVFFQARNFQQRFFIDRDASHLDWFREAMSDLRLLFEQVGMGDMELIEDKTLDSVHSEYLGAVNNAAITATDLWELERSLASTFTLLKAKGEEVQAGMLEILTQAQTASHEASRRASQIILGGATVVAALLVIVLSWIGITTTRRITETSELLKEMATGSGDLTRRLPQRFVTCSDLWNCDHSECPSHGVADPCWSHVGSLQLGKDSIQCAQLISGQVDACDSCQVYVASRQLEADEFDHLAHWFNTFIDRIRHLVAQVKDASIQMASTAEQLSATTDQIATSGKQATSQAQDVAAGAEEMSATVKTVSANTHAVSEASGHARSTALDGGAVVSEAVSAMAEIAEVVEKAAGTVRSLGEESEKIDVVIQVIEDIADQTNLLALNAAIEAARAGDHGRGFAVVADEVRKLAEKTVKATQEIGQTVVSIQSESRQAVADIDQGMEVIATGQELGGRAGEAIRNIETQVSTASEETAQIAAATEQLAATIEEMAGNMDQIARGVDQNTSAATELADTAAALAGKADQLKAMTERFRT